MELIALESRDCPAPLIATAGRFVPFEGYEGPIETAASGDVLVVTANTIPHVKVFVAGKETASFYAYDPAFDRGINLATDGEHIATGTDRGAPHVREFTLHGVELRSFYQGSPESIGGVRVSYARDNGSADLDASADDSSGVGSTGERIRPSAKYQIYLDGASDLVVRGVGGIFQSFDVGVTNEYPSMADPRRIATVIFGGAMVDGNAGQAVVNGLFQQSEFVSLPARVYSDSLSESQQKQAAAHEAGHLFGAVHVTDTRSVFFSSLAGGSWIDPLNDRILTQRIGRA